MLTDLRKSHSKSHPVPGLLGNTVNHQDPSIPSPILPFSWECLSPSPSPVTSWFSHLPGRPDLLGCLLCSYLARAPFLLSSPQASTDHTDPPPLLSSEAGLLWRHFCTVRMSWMSPPPMFLEHIPLVLLLLWGDSCWRTPKAVCTLNLSIPQILGQSLTFSCLCIALSFLPAAFLLVTWPLQGALQSSLDSEERAHAFITSLS